MKEKRANQHEEEQKIVSLLLTFVSQEVAALQGFGHGCISGANTNPNDRRKEKEKNVKNK
jgi:hypothetical protein